MNTQKILIAAAILAVAASAQATVLSFTLVTKVDSNSAIIDIDLDNLGPDPTLDWALYSGWSGLTGVEFDRRTGGTAIGSLTRADNNNNVTAATVGPGVGFLFDYTNGVNFANGTDVVTGTGRRIGNAATSPDNQFFLGVTVPSTSGSIHLFISGDERVLTNNISATNGVDNASTGNFGWNFVNSYIHYRLDYSDATIGESVNFTWNSDGSDFNSRVVFNGVALTAPIPEPGALGALFGAGALTALIRRRK